MSALNTPSPIALRDSSRIREGPVVRGFENRASEASERANFQNHATRHGRLATTEASRIREEPRRAVGDGE